MARPHRLQFAGALYHVTSRGNGRADIYFSDDDRLVEHFGVHYATVSRAVKRCEAGGDT